MNALKAVLAAVAGVVGLAVVAHSYGWMASLAAAAACAGIYWWAVAAEKPNA